MICDLENGRISPELIDSARIMAAKELDYTFWQRTDFENYSGAWTIEWTGNGAIEFNASLWYPGTGDDDATIIRDVTVRYDFREKRMECVVND